MSDRKTDLVYDDRRHVWFVDTENVRDHWVEYIRLRPDDTMLLFFTKNSGGIAFYHLAQFFVNCPTNQLRLIQCEPGPNSLDFNIAMELGRYSTADPDAQLLVISDDAGYDSILRSLARSGYQANRVAGYKDLVMPPDNLPYPGPVVIDRRNVPFYKLSTLRKTELAKAPVLPKGFVQTAAPVEQTKVEEQPIVATPEPETSVEPKEVETPVEAQTSPAPVPADSQPVYRVYGHFTREDIYVSHAAEALHRSMLKVPAPEKEEPAKPLIIKKGRKEKVREVVTRFCMDHFVPMSYVEKMVDACMNCKKPYRKFLGMKLNPIATALGTASSEDIGSLMIRAALEELPLQLEQIK